MRVVFLGSGAFAIPSLHALLDAGHDVAAVVTQPDREKGRGRALQAPPLKPHALDRSLRLLQPRRIREEAALLELLRLAPELLVVVAYGQILPPSVLGIAPLGAVNVHGSLLPRYRGAAPIQWAIARGEEETGVTTMLLDEGLDTGPILLSASTRIGPDETAPALEARLGPMGARLLVETIPRLEAGDLEARPQDASAATLAPIIRKEDGQIDWTTAAVHISRRVRAFLAWPGSSTTLLGRGLKVLRAEVASPHPGDPGEILGMDASGLLVACGEGTCLRILEVKPESRRAMDAQAFVLGARLPTPARFV